MKSFSLVLILVSALTVASCGGGNSAVSGPHIPIPTPTPTPPPPPTPEPPPAPGGPFTENWQLQPLSGTLLEMRLAWNVGTTSLQGSALILDPSGCFWFTDSSTSSSRPVLMPLTGTVDGNGNFTATSIQYQGQKFFLNGTFSTDRSSLSASYSGSGSCASALSGSLQGERVEPLTGTYEGTLMLNGDPLTTTIVLTQASQTDPTDGFFHLTGTVTIVGATCSADYPLDATNSTILGNYVGLVRGDGLDDNELFGRTSSDALTVTLEGYPYDEACTHGATGQLQRQ